MTPYELQKTISKKLYDNWSETPIAWPNKAFNTKGIAEYIRITIKSGDSQMGEQNVKGVGVRPGVIMINIFTERNKGVLRGFELGTMLESIFGMDIGTSENGKKVVFNQPSTSDEGLDSEQVYQHHLFKVGFRTFVGD